jgi:hypothetical protein
MYHVLHAFVGRGGGGGWVGQGICSGFTKGVTSIKYGCIRVASFVPLVKFGSSDVPF